MPGETSELGRRRPEHLVLLVNVLLLMVAGLGWGCGSVGYTGEDVRETRVMTGQGERFRALGVVPFDPDGYDTQIAGRARRQLESRGFEAELIVVEGSGSAYVEMVLREICEGSRSPIDAQGVVFVTWDRLELRDCASGEVAYEVEGGYAGVDRMVEDMVRYFRGEPAPGQE